MKLGRLERVQLRTIWEHEQYDFSKWLAKEENINELGNVLNLNLYDIETEKFVGNYRCDILCKDELTNKIILIENQLEATNHDHLGKIITYASGLNASVIVWIVENAKEEHKAAIEWLNKNMNSEISFFLIELHVYKIGDSIPAPQFKIIQQPNDFTLQVKENMNSSKIINESMSKRLEFWSLLNATLEERNFPFKKRKATTDQLGQKKLTRNYFIKTSQNIPEVFFILSLIVFFRYCNIQQTHLFLNLIPLMLV